MSSKVVHFDHILDMFVGPAGAWQWRQFALILANSFATSMAFMLHIFSAHAPQHRCHVPACEEDKDNATFLAPWAKFAIPRNAKSDAFLNEAQQLSKCEMFAAEEGEQCVPDTFDPEGNVSSCAAFVYDKSIFSSTLATEFDLVCGEAFKIQFLGSLLMVGLTLGCMLGGPLGDKVGRKRTLIGGLLILAPAVVIEGFVPNYITFAGLRLTVFTMVGIMWVSSHTLLLELFGTYHRKVAYTINSLMFSIFACIQALVAYLERDWRYMHIIVGLLISTVVPFVLIFLKESMRWLILNGREEEAEGMLLEVAKTNNRHLSDTQCKEMRSNITTMASSAKLSRESQLSVLHMFKSGYVATTLIILTTWISSVCSYYALALNVGKLAGDIFLNYVVSSLVDVPATLYILFTIDRFGRKSCIITAQVVLGLCSLAMGFVPKDQSAAILLLYLVGRFSSTVSVNTAWFYTAELFPTNLRAQSVATCSLIARVFGTTSSFVDGLSALWAPLPMVVLGTPALVSAALTLFLPETMGKELKEMAKEDEDVEAKDVNGIDKDHFEEIPL